MASEDFLQALLMILFLLCVIAIVGAIFLLIKRSAGQDKKSDARYSELMTLYAKVSTKTAAALCSECNRPLIKSATHCLYCGSEAADGETPEAAAEEKEKLTEDVDSFREDRQLSEKPEPAD